MSGGDLLVLRVVQTELMTTVSLFWGECVVIWLQEWMRQILRSLPTAIDKSDHFYFLISHSPYRFLRSSLSTWIVITCDHINTFYILNLGFEFGSGSVAADIYSFMGIFLVKKKPHNIITIYVVIFNKHFWVPYSVLIFCYSLNFVSVISLD